MFCDRCNLFWTEAISKAQYPDAIRNSEDVSWAAHETTLHRSIRDLKCASDRRCRLCRLIYSTPTRYEHHTLLEDHDEAIEVVLDINPNNGPHPVLSVKFRETNGHDVRIPKRMVASCSGVMTDGDLAKALDVSINLVNDHTGSDGSLEFAAYWLRKCLGMHEQCRLKATSHKAGSFVPTRLLDVSNDCIRLIESKYDLDKNLDQSFVALSHCWGLIPIIRTLQENYEDHRRLINSHKLSKTFREAIHTTRKLGYRYIWIDSLCIIQDDSEDWAKEAGTMCDVYQNAILTIAAAHAPGGDVGCFTKRDGLLNLPFYIELPGADSNDESTRIQFTSYGRTSELGGGDPALFGRAWVLQEQLLSPRMLMFDGTQLGWECLTTYGSEKTPTSGTMRHSLYHKAVRNGIMDDYEYFDHPEASDEGSQTRDFWAKLKHQYWCDTVMDYTHRGMTKSKDRLVALAGIAKALDRHTNNTYYAGLWSTHFTTGLLWSIAHNEKFQLAAAQGFDLDGNKTIRHELPLAPTWSWASVTAPVMYAETELLSYDRVCEVLKVDVSGSADKQVGRVEIRGHIRRGYVNPVYPYAIREAATWLPHMMAPLPTGRKGLEYIKFKNRLFHPNDYFLFSDKHPAPTLKNKSPHHLSKKGIFCFMRGFFRPDELIDPCTEITFIAIAQQHFGSSLTSMLNTHDEYAALRVHTLVLVPIKGKPGIYRRIGLAAWDQCAWYGYLCGWKDERDRRVYRPGNYSGDGYRQDDSLVDRLARKYWWDDLEALEECEVGRHDHAYGKDALPGMAMYHRNIDVMEGTVVIV